MAATAIDSTAIPGTLPHGSRAGTRTALLKWLFKGCPPGYGCSARKRPGGPSFTLKQIIKLYSYYKI